jgi:hypothetical protein
MRHQPTRGCHPTSSGASGLPFCDSVSLYSEGGQVYDTAEYAKSFIHTDREMRRWKATDKQLVIDVLTKKADGM